MGGTGHRVGSIGNKCALAGSAGYEAIALELAVCLEHRVRIDRQFRDHLPGGGKLVTRLESADPDRMANLLDQLPVGGNSGCPIEAKFNHCAMRIVKRREHSDLARRRQEALAGALFSLVPKWPWGAFAQT